MNRAQRREARALTAAFIRQGILPPGSVLVGVSPDGTGEWCVDGCCPAVWEQTDEAAPGRTRQRPEDDGSVGGSSPGSAFGLSQPA